MGVAVHAYAAHSAGADLKPYEFELPDLGPDYVDIAVSHCGMCHSDLSMRNNDWGFTQYPFVPGHEVVGKIKAVGSNVSHLKPGQTVGMGWFAGSCMICQSCMSGNHNLCPTSEQTIVGRHGGYADLVRCKSEWALPLPEGLDVAKAGPLFCGGITVFNPLVQFDVKPLDRVGVVGIGGLGHYALQFLKHWGCEVVAFTSSASKHEEARKLGAHHVATSTDADFKKWKGAFNFIIVTANVPLDWMGFISTLAPKGRLHFVGAVPEPVSLILFPMLMSQISVSGSPLGSPVTTARMLDFCVRHQINAVVETFPMSEVNHAFEHLHAGKARYRIVLANE
ncbi:MAG: NAD(P)-dependent alcohol dehydrogenase [Verrucomicrobiota bacterium]|nr:NAD(P)-dependent alcohol dehydrogenase [Verrucomicrobiota bacterium]